MTLADFAKLFHEIGNACDELRYSAQPRWEIVMHPHTREGLGHAKKRYVTTLYGLNVVDDTRYELGEFVFRLKSVE